MAKRIGNQTFEFENKPSIIGYGAVGSKTEKEGRIGHLFDRIFDDPTLGMDSWEQAESALQKNALEIALKKAKKCSNDINLLFAGDLLNQCVGSTFGTIGFNIPFVGVYGACSTMALSTIMAANSVDSNLAKNAAAVTSSHFCSAERQYRFPLEYGGQRPPTAQWTATASGAVIVSNEENNIKIVKATVGKVNDLGITDANNMGAAMAPADVKIRPYPLGIGVWNLDLFSIVIFALAAF